MPPPTDIFRYKESDIVLMTDEEANRDTARWPSETNIVSLGIRIPPYALSRPLPMLIGNNPMDPASGIARSRPRRIERRCVRFLLCASESTRPSPL